MLAVPGTSRCPSYKFMAYAIAWSLCVAPARALFGNDPACLVNWEVQVCGVPETCNDAGECTCDDEGGYEAKDACAEMTEVQLLNICAFYGLIWFTIKSLLLATQ